MLILGKSALVRPVELSSVTIPRQIPICCGSSPGSSSVDTWEPERHGILWPIICLKALELSPMRKASIVVQLYVNLLGMRLHIVFVYHTCMLGWDWVL